MIYDNSVLFRMASADTNGMDRKLQRCKREVVQNVDSTKVSFLCNTVVV